MIEMHLQQLVRTRPRYFYPIIVSFGPIIFQYFNFTQNHPINLLARQYQSKHKVDFNPFRMLLTGCNCNFHKKLRSQKQKLEHWNNGWWLAQQKHQVKPDPDCLTGFRDSFLSHISRISMDQFVLIHLNGSTNGNVTTQQCSIWNCSIGTYDMFHFEKWTQKTSVPGAG